VPPLVYWGHYVAHDNNRDGLGMALALSRNQMKTFLEYHPTILHDLHESVPFLYTSTGTGPYNAWLDPIVIDEWNLLAYHEIEEMTKRGVPGCGRMASMMVGRRIHVLCRQWTHSIGRFTRPLATVLRTLSIAPSGRNRNAIGSGLIRPSRV